MTADNQSYIEMANRGFTVWLTGLPCSGKSTLAKLLSGYLTNHGRGSVILDGDEVRERLSKGLGFSKEDRAENIRRVAYVCRLINQVNGIAIAALISPFRLARQEALLEIGNFVEVYVKCPSEVCAKRDIKGHYAKALAGDLQNFTGVSDPYEAPLDPQIVLDTDKQTPEESLCHMVEELKLLGLLHSPSRQEMRHA